MPEVPAGSALVDELQRCAPARRRRRLCSFLGEVVASLLDDPPDRLGPDARIFEMGLGSLVVIELKRRLESEFRREFPVTLFFQHVTLGEIADYLEREVFPPGADGRGEATTAGERDAEGRSHEEAELLRKVAELEKGIRR